MISPTSQTETPVYTVVISEKGGSERREVFTLTELNVGRVQGNELMLPKGNVSKRHARLLYRDGRFIVTDLNSTNGTYVNRRRIAQATIVREGDRIYIGDFVLRIELGDEPRDSRIDSEQLGASSARAPEASASRPGLRISAEHVRRDFASVPAPPKVPSNAGVASSPVSSEVEERRTSPQSFPIAESVVRAPSEERIPDPAVAARRRQCIAKVVDRVRVALAPQKIGAQLAGELASRIESLALDQARNLGRETALPDDLTAEQLAVDASTELVKLGPLGPLLADETTTLLSISRFDQISVVQKGRWVRIEPAFSSAASLELAIERLCRQAGHNWDPKQMVVECELESGAALKALRGKAAVGGPLLQIVKSRKVSMTLEELVRRGMTSRGMATFLQRCVVARANILVIGPPEAGLSHVLSALAFAASGERVVELSELHVLSSQLETATRIALSRTENPGEAVRIAGALPDSRLLVTMSQDEVTAATLEAISGGSDGVLAGYPASDMRRALAQLPVVVTRVRRGVLPEVAQRWVESAFDLVIEVSRLRDHRMRVLRISEIAADAQGLRPVDIFTFSAERVAAGGAIDGVFHATGHVPRILERVRSLGLEVQDSLFARPASR